MQKHIPEWFDQAISLLHEAQELYRRRRYWDSYRTMKRLTDKLFDLQCSLELDISRKRTTPPRELSDEEKQELAGFNTTLSVLEEKIEKETALILEEYEERASGEEFLSDCRIGVDVQFYLDENDPNYCEDRDNILAEVRLDGNGMSDYEGENWNDRDPDIEPEKRPYHCWLFHELYSNATPSLEWEDLLRIRYIWTDITICYKSRIEVTNGERDPLGGNRNNLSLR